LERRLGDEDRLSRWFRETRVRGEGDKSARAVDVLRGRDARAKDIMEDSAPSELVGMSDETVHAVEVELKYEGYVRRERERAERLRSMATFSLRDDLPYADFVTLSYEAREKLARVRPDTLAHASRIPGVSPSDLQNLVLEVRRLGSLAARS
jgi:tRNA uridine 5-carboxymethylaminomethyl modification enzyme